MRKIGFQARQSIPMDTLQQIRNLNRLDAELYQYAKSVFMQQLEHLTQNTEDAFALSNDDLIAEMVSLTSFSSISR